MQPYHSGNQLLGNGRWRQRPFFLLLGAILIALALVLVARPAATSPVGPEVVEIVPDEVEPSITTTLGRTSALTGQPLVLYRPDYPVRPGAPEEQARQFLRENARQLHLQQADLSDLRHRVTRTSLSGSTVRFTQYIGQLPVYKAEIAVHINNDNRVTFVVNDYKSTAVLSSLAPTLSAADAEQAARSYLNPQEILSASKTSLVVYHNQGITRLAYTAGFFALTPLGDWEVLVDAHSGELFKVVNNAHDLKGDKENSAAVLVDGDGNVFDPDPLSSANATYGDTGFVDNNDANSTQLNGELVNVTLKDITFSGGMYTLVGPYAEVQDFESPFKGLFAQASSSFPYNRFDDAFEAVNTYYHIDSSMRYINVTLGIPLMPYQYTTGVRFDPHGLSGADNSHYITSSGRLAFGEGCVDDAEDSDVIHHELGHGLHDWVTSGGLSQVNGLSEGSGDYWAQSYNRTLGYWTPSDPQFNWVFNWDGHNPCWPGRSSDYFGHYPEDLTGSIHTDGQIWSTANMKIWDAIGGPKTDTIFLEGLGMTGGSSSQDDAANAVYQAAIDLGYDVADLQAVNTIYSNTGYTIPVLPIPDFIMQATPQNQSVCAPADAVYTVAVQAVFGFSDSVTLSTSGEPANTTVTINPNSSTAPYTATVTIGNTGAAAAGDYAIAISGASATATHTTTVGLNLATAVPGSLSLIAPADNSTNVNLRPTFQWTAATQGNQYNLEVATDPGFGNIVYTAVVTGASHTASMPLDASTLHYWRVTAENACGLGSTSAVWSFTTASSTMSCNSAAIDFEAGLPDDWQSTFINNVYWTSTDNTIDPVGCNGGAGGDVANETGGSGEAMCANSDATNNPASAYDARLISAPFNLAGFSAASLDFNWRHRQLGSSAFKVEISTDGGGSWDTLLNNTAGNPGGASGDAASLDLSSYVGESAVLARFSYTGSGWDWYAQVDNVLLSCTGGAPDANVTPGSLNSTQPAGSQVTQTLTIQNLGAAELTWALTEDANGSCSSANDIPWLSAAPLNGTTPIGSSTPVTVLFDSSGLAGGSYSGALCLASNDPGEPLIVIPVSLEVEEFTIYMSVITNDE